VQVYQGSLASTDLQLLSIFQLFEAECQVSIASLLCQWSGTLGMTSNTSGHVIYALDPSRIFKTCIHFPLWRQCSSSLHNEGYKSSELTAIYDPLFLIALCSHFLNHSYQENPHLTIIDLFQTNIISLLMRALSSEDASFRTLALNQISHIQILLKVGFVSTRISS
jgi:nucleolar pre-ribosomal-associated protein 1